MDKVRHKMIFMRSLAILFMLFLTSSSAANPTWQLDLSEDQHRLLQSNPKFYVYLIECALSNEDEVTMEQAGDVKTFKGYLGLAPDWKTRALTESEQRWVSACLLARINYYGEKVRISTRADNAKHIQGLQADEQEVKQYSVYEAGFYGNLFAATPTAFACIPNRTEETQAILHYKKRICSIPVAMTDEGQQVSACRFIVNQSCPNIPEIIHVYHDPN